MLRKKKIKVFGVHQFILEVDVAKPRCSSKAFQQRAAGSLLNTGKLILIK